MSLYYISQKNEHYCVEAEDFDGAVALWRYYMKVEKNGDGNEQLDSLTVLHTGRVIRDEDFAQKERS